MATWVVYRGRVLPACWMTWVDRLRAQELRQAVARHPRELSDLCVREPFTDRPLFQLISRWKPEPLLPEAAEFSHGNRGVVERVAGLGHVGRDDGR